MTAWSPPTPPWISLVAAVEAAGGPAYEYREVDPANDTNGGQPGGNIRVAFLFNPHRGVSFVDRPGGSATTSVGVRTFLGTAQLTQSPGLIDPTNAAFDDSRKPLVGQFRFKGRKLFVIGNHFDSKGGDDPLMGRFQPIAEPSAVQRHQQATIVRDFVDRIRAIESRAAIVVLGDLNDFEFSPTADILVGDGYLTDLPRTLPPSERYTYDYEGNSEVLDHILHLRRPGRRAVLVRRGAHQRRVRQPDVTTTTRRWCGFRCSRCTASSDGRDSDRSHDRGCSQARRPGTAPVCHASTASGLRRAQDLARAPKRNDCQEPSPYQPPSTDSVAPLTNDAFGEARNATAWATSSGVANRPIGT